MTKSYKTLIVLLGLLAYTLALALVIELAHKARDRDKESSVLIEKDAQIEELKREAALLAALPSMAPPAEPEIGGTEEDVTFPDVTFSFPIASEDWKITSDFGTRISPRFKVYRHHQGIDISIIDPRMGMPQIVPIADGAVKDRYIAHETKGKHIVIDHGYGMESGYLHLSETFIHEKRPDGTVWQVKAGVPMARMGATGAADGAHLHFYIKIDGEFVNPALYLEQYLPEWALLIIADPEPEKQTARRNELRLTEF